MPIHDWTQVRSGTFHDFHQDWTIAIKRALNRGILPPGYFAMADQRVGGPEPDVVAYEVRDLPTGPGGTAVAEASPKISQVASVETDNMVYARKANRIAVRHELGRVVAMIEVISPGNKDSTHAANSFISKVVEFLENGIHVVIVDLFPPTPRDPDGIHKEIWNAMTREPFAARPEGKLLTVAGYDAGEPITAYVEPLAVGDTLPDAPLFLAPGWYVNIPLETTYAESWAETPEIVRNLVSPTQPA